MRKNIYLSLVIVGVMLGIVFLSGCTNTQEAVKEDAKDAWEDLKSVSYKNGYKDGFLDGQNDFKNNFGVGTSKEDCMELAEDDYCTGYDAGYWDGYHDKAPEYT